MGGVDRDCGIDSASEAEGHGTRGGVGEKMTAAQKTRETALRLFACDCASRALKRWVKSGRQPDPRWYEVLKKVRAVATGKSPPGELVAAGELADRASKEFIENECDPSHVAKSQGCDLREVIHEQLSWYGALNCVHAACADYYEDAAEYAAREGRREARRVNDEEREIAWQTKRLEKLRIIPRPRKRVGSRRAPCGRG